MSESWGGKLRGITSRIRDVAGGTDGAIDVDIVMTRAREAIANASSDIDREALLARLKDVADKAEGTVDREKLKQLLDDVDREKVKGWLDEAKTLSAGAAAALETQGERLAERAPGAVDKLLGVAKEVLGDLTDNEALTREGEMEQFRGEIKERFADAPEAEDPAAR